MDYQQYNGLIERLESHCPNATFIRGEAAATKVLAGIASEEERVAARKFGGILEGELAQDTILTPGIHLAPGRQGFMIDNLGPYATHAVAVLHEVGHHLDQTRGNGKNPLEQVFAECRADGFALAYLMIDPGMDGAPLAKDMALSRRRGLDGTPSQAALDHYTAPFLPAAQAVGQEWKAAGKRVDSPEALHALMDDIDTVLTYATPALQQSLQKMSNDPARVALPKTASSPMKEVAFATRAALDCPEHSQAIRLWSTWARIDRGIRDGATMTGTELGGHIGRLARDSAIVLPVRSQLGALRPRLDAHTGPVSRSDMLEVSTLLMDPLPGLGQHLGMMADTLTDRSRAPSKGVSR